mgnify:CR=1 FL=1
MRQFLSWRYWLAVVVIVAMIGVLLLITGGSSPTAGVNEANSRRIDLIARTSTIRSSGSWSVADGRSMGDATAVLSDGRVLAITDGTLGESSCLYPEALNACVMLADTLGDGVVWFALVPAPAGDSDELSLAAIDELLDGVTYARLVNGWEIPLLDKVVRRCDEETRNLAAFVQRFAKRHVTIVDLTQGQVSAVQCDA